MTQPMLLDTNFIIHFLIVTLAGYRAALMVAAEPGPFAIFEKLRDWIASKFPAQDYKQHWIDYGFNCPLCTGFWLCLLLGLAWLTGLGFLQWAICFLATAGLQAFLTKISLRD